MIISLFNITNIGDPEGEGSIAASSCLDEEGKD